MKLSLFSKIFLVLPLLAISLIVFVNYLPLHSGSSEAAGAPCLFEIVTRAECIGETSSLGSAGYHVSVTSDTFTGLPGVADLLFSLALLSVGFATLLHVAHNRYERYAWVIIKQKWKDGQSIEKLFNPIKIALRSGILERKEPSFVIA